MVGIVSALMTFIILFLSKSFRKKLELPTGSHYEGLQLFTLKVLFLSLKYAEIPWLMMQVTRLVGESGEGSTLSSSQNPINPYSVAVIEDEAISIEEFHLTNKDVI